MRLPSFALAAALLGLAGCGADQPPPHRRVAEVRGPAPSAGLPATTVLYPRHRILSPGPTLQIVTPGWTGSIRVDLRTSRGLLVRLETRRRAIPWPDGFELLRVGERGQVRVAAPTGIAFAGFERAEPPVPRSLWVDGAPADARLLLDHDLPMEAFLLLAAEGLADLEIARRARREAALPTPAPWRPLRVSDSIPWVQLRRRSGGPQRLPIHERRIP